MPTIEREIPYTLSAYSGGLADEIKQRKRNKSSNEYESKLSPSSELEAQSESNVYVDKSQDVYDFKESDDDGLDKKNKNYEIKDADISKSITSDQDEGKSGSDMNMEDKEKGNEEDENMNGSSVDADDESDEKTPCPRRVYKSRFSSRLSAMSPEHARTNQDRPQETLELATVGLKSKTTNLPNTKSNHISSGRTRSSTRSKSTILDNDSKTVDEPECSHHLSGNSNITSIDANNAAVSASSLVLAALSAAEQDLGSNSPNIAEIGEKNRALTPLDEVSYATKQIEPKNREDENMFNVSSVKNDSSVTISTYSETQKTNEDESENADSNPNKSNENNHLIGEPTSSVTITPHGLENDDHETIKSCNMSVNHMPSSENRMASEYISRSSNRDNINRDTTNLDPENYRVDNVYSTESKIDNLVHESSSSRAQALNSVEIIPVPKSDEISAENNTTFEEEYQKKNMPSPNYSKTDINTVHAYPGTQIKSPLPRQPTPSNSVMEHHSQHHSSSRSPSSLPPPPTTPHFPANSYPPHFPSADLAQFSNQLYHSGLDSLARSCYPPFRPHSNSTPTDYSTFPRSSPHTVDFISHSIPASTHEGHYGGAINGMNNYSNVNGTSTGISSSPSSSSLDLSQTSSSSSAAIAAAAVADILPPSNSRSPFGNNSSSPSHLSPFYPPHCNMINEHLLNVATGPKDLTSPRLPPSHMHNADPSVRQGTNPYIHQNYSLYDSSRFPASASPVGYSTPSTPPNSHNRLPHISPAASPYHHYGYFQ